MGQLYLTRILSRYVYASALTMYQTIPTKQASVHEHTQAVFMNILKPSYSPSSSAHLTSWPLYMDQAHLANNDRDLTKLETRQTQTVPKQVGPYEAQQINSQIQDIQTEGSILKTQCSFKIQSEHKNNPHSLNDNCLPNKKDIKRILINYLCCPLVGLHILLHYMKTLSLLAVVLQNNQSRFQSQPKTNYVKWCLIPLLFLPNLD